MKRILLILWQIPQALLGGLVFLFVRKERIDVRDGYILVDVVPRWGLSLAPFVFVPFMGDDKTLAHEMGHAKQSLYAGPLYLPIIGLPSIIRAAIWRLDKSRKNADYYKGYPENWADKLGGVERS